MNTKNVLCETVNYIDNPNKAGKWILKSSSTEYVSEEFVKAPSEKSTLSFFRRLGGYESVQTGYTKDGVKVHKLTSINPDKSFKCVRTFIYEK